MESGFFAALIVRREHGLAVYGPFATRSDARLGADWLGSTDPRVLATRPIAMYPPDSDPLSTTNPPRQGEVVQLPDEIASLVATRTEEATVDAASAVAVLVVIAAPLHPALLVGPFDSPTAARTWAGRVGGTSDHHTAECYLLPLQPSDLGIDDTPDETQHARATSVVLLDTDDASVVFGPFDNGLDAALYWHDVTRVLTLTNVQQVHICELASPTETATTMGPATDEIASTDKRVRGWAVRTTARGDDEQRLVGPFYDEHHARTWSTKPDADSTTTVLPICAP